MVPWPLYALGNGANVTNNAAHVGMQVSTPGFDNASPTSLCAEDNVIVKAQMGGRHVDPRTLSG
jgi:hypothetical protein